MTDLIFSMRYDDKQVRDRLARLQDKTGDLTPAMMEIGESQILATDQRFQTETDPQGRPWQPLSQKTLAAKKAAGQISKILQATGMMRSRTAYQASSDRCVVTNNDVKAAKHHLGRGVPKRQFLGVSAEDKIEIIAILDDHIMS